MTGIEAGAGKIAGAVVTSAAKAVGGAIEEDAKEAERLLKIAEKSGQLDKAALIRAKRSVVKQHIRLKLTQPLGRIARCTARIFQHPIR